MKADSKNPLSRNYGSMGLPVNNMPDAVSAMFLKLDKQFAQQVNRHNSLEALI